jgi:uncharacterized protein (DUF1015 family)
VPEPGAPTIPVVPLPDVRPPAPTGLEIRPFRALTYRQHDPAHLARVSSPAYDLVTPAGRERLAAADPYNIVRLILPRGDGEGAAARDDTLAGAGVHPPAQPSAKLAATTLRRWTDEGVLEADGVPALWLYELAPPGGVPATVGWLGAVALPDAGSAAVLPHEDTYAPAVEGRRALLAATHTDLEPIVLAHDPDPALPALVDRARTGAPALQVTDDDGVQHRLWRVIDPGLLADVRATLAGTRAVIADGHHRFAAAQAHHRGAPDVTGADAVFALVTSSGPGGLRVEAIHRVLPDLPLDAALAAARRSFAEVVAVPADGPEGAVGAARAWLSAAPPGSFLLGAGARLIGLRRPTGELAGAVPTEAPPAWRELDVVLAHHGLIEQVWQLPDEPESVVVAHDVATALREAAERGGTALLLRAPSPGDVAAVARAGARMPRKSTLFVPKPRTGLVLRPLDG